jgi:protein phosphatase
VVNQDRFLVDQARGVMLVADGMGGMRAGERASEMAVDLLPAHPDLAERENLSDAKLMSAISNAFLDTSDEIVRTGQADSKLEGMGTTAVMAVLQDSRLFIAGLGDSRAYLLRDGHLRQYTIDHSMAQLLVNQGTISPAEAKRHRWRHMLWQFLGYRQLKNGPQVCTISLEAGDRLLLVTDGVTDVLSTAQLLAGLCKNVTAQGAAHELVESAVRYGTRDDATCVALFVD